jgi:hypothetical protein
MFMGLLCCGSLALEKLRFHKLWMEDGILEC